ncbi:helix-turn-helix domain-containing protein [Longirhabdus pacifica]|uniref:helix-turn-helix domain-containing protein n=1 Tax=Longirhabdus pacifica TaxID=2305227 RepID=UPI001F0C503A|nr:helix-turn-helix domain-containing protein [Longirhabdus pacifica]
MKNVSIDTIKLNLTHLADVFNIDYVTMHQIKDELENLNSEDKRLTYNNEQIQNFLIKCKENNFLYLFETDITEPFCSRLLVSKEYNLQEEDEWVEPKILKFLLDYSAWDISKLREEKKVKFKQVENQRVKKGSKSSLIFLYEKSSLIHYIEHRYDSSKLKKIYIDMLISKQFLTVKEAMKFAGEYNIEIKQATFYRKINKHKIPATRINKALRIPKREFLTFLHEEYGVT